MAMFVSRVVCSGIVSVTAATHLKKYAACNRVQRFLMCCLRNKMDYGTEQPKSETMYLTNQKIGTHNGFFHSDEALACFLLKLLPEYKHYDIVRTRNQNILDDCDVVVDVGGEFDPVRHRYDHHQRTFNESMNSLNREYPWTTKLSSAGLIYFHFGHRILSEILGTGPDDPKVNTIFARVYENFLEEIDGIDNGIPACTTPRYIIGTNITSRVKLLNPSWNEECADYNEKFHKAMKLIGDEFVEKVLRYSDVWWPAKTIVETALSDRYNVHYSGEILELKNGSCPWQEHLFALERELGINPLIKYIIFRSSNGYRVQCVPIEGQPYSKRLSLPEEWRGLANDELSKISGIPGCTFVHASGFIGANITKGGAVDMAEKALEFQETIPLNEANVGLN